MDFTYEYSIPEIRKKSVIKSQNFVIFVLPVTCKQLYIYGTDTFKYRLEYSNKKGFLWQ